MSEFLGSRISLISKSDIRYVGTLHEINSEDSTVSLENVHSFGTEGRKGKPDEEIPPSSQVYEYIVFRGSDVKDLRIEEAPAASNEKPPAIPDDPAILGARPRPANGPTPSSQRGPPGPGGFSQNPYPNNFYPPPIGHWGRGGGPVPGPGGFGAMPFPPPGWSYPGQFPPGPGGPAPWNNNFGAFPPGPPGAPGAPGTSGTPGAAGQINRPGSNVPGPEQKPAPIGAGSDKKTGASGMQELPSEPKSLGQGPTQQQKLRPPTPPGATSPTEETKATSTTLGATSKDPAAQSGHIPTGPSAPTGPKATRTTAAAVAIPVIPRTTAGPSSTKPAGDASGGPPTATAIKDATQAAKAAVAMAMAKLDQGPSQQNGTAAAMDNLTKKVNEMRVNATRGGVQSRGRGRGGRSAAAKVEVPDTDFDFASSNAKFNKEDLVKEASSSGPVSDSTNGADAAQFQASPTELPAYNKSRSFFDNISSESKERAENGGQKPGGREWRGEEQRRNIETFGQGSVDSGYRGYRGRGRNRGGARGRGYRGGRGGSHRPRDNSAIAQ